MVELRTLVNSFFKCISWTFVTNILRVEKNYPLLNDSSKTGFPALDFMKSRNREC